VVVVVTTLGLVQLVLVKIVTAVVVFLLAWMTAVLLNTLPVAARGGCVKHSRHLISQHHV